MHANYPSMIRVLTEKWPHLKPTPDQAHQQKGYTEWQANVLSALQAGEDGIDEKEEREERRASYLAEYRRKLAVKRGELRALSVAEVTARKVERSKRSAMRSHPETFDPSVYEVHGLGHEAFKKMLAHNKLRYTQFSVPHPCQLCEDGPIKEAVFLQKQADATQLRLDGKVVPPELLQELQKIRSDLTLYRTHTRCLLYPEKRSLKGRKT